jgi:hypothetical protein
MRSTTVPRATSRARRASDSPPAHMLARAGLTARGIICILIGWVAVLVALGHGAHEADQQGACNCSRQALRLGLAMLLGFGFAAYALWRLSEAAYGVAARERHRPPAEVLGQAVIYAAFAYLTFEVHSCPRRRELILPAGADSGDQAEGARAVGPAEDALISLPAPNGPEVLKRPVPALKI